MDKLYDADVERGVIGCLIIFDGMIDNCTLELSDFYFKHNRLIFSAIKKLQAQGKPIDSVLIWSIIQDDFNDYPNFITFSEFIEYGEIRGVMSDNFAEYEKELRELRHKRDLQNINEIASVIIQDKNKTVAETVAFIEKEIEEKITKKAAPHEQTSFNSYDLASDYFAYIENSIDNNEYNPDDIIKIGFPEMDNDMFFERGQQVVIAARQNMGKSSLAIDMINRLRKSGRRVVFFSFEMKKKLVTARLLSCESQIPSNFIQFKGRPLYPQERLIIEDILASQIMFHDNFDLHTPYDLVTTDYIKKILKQMKKEGRPADVFLVDHIGLMKYTGKSDGEMGVEIGNNAMLLRKMAQEFNCLNIILSHITKEGASGKMPQMHHIAGSDKISRHSDVVLLLHRDDYYMDPDEAAKKGIKGVAKIWAAKVRDGTGNLYKYQYRGDISRFEPIKSAILGGG